MVEHRGIAPRIPVWKTGVYLSTPMLDMALSLLFPDEFLGTFGELWQQCPPFNREVMSENAVIKCGSQRGVREGQRQE